LSVVSPAGVIVLEEEPGGEEPAGGSGTLGTGSGSLVGLGSGSVWTGGWLLWIGAVSVTGLAVASVVAGN
jgi:hypothetical protein